MIVDAMKEFKKAFFKVEKETGKENSFPKENLIARYEYQFQNTPGAPSDSLDKWVPSKKVSQILQSLYITKPPNSIEKKHFLNQAPDSSSYSKVHGKFHPPIRDFFREIWLLRHFFG